MSFAVTHIVLTIILIELFRKYWIKDNKKFPRYYILIGALAGIFPDFDIAAYYVLYFFGFTVDQVHHTFMHSIFVPLVFLVFGLFFFVTKFNSSYFGTHHIKISMSFFILTLGSVLHLILDIITNDVPLFYPFSKFVFGLDLISRLPADLALWTIMPAIDGVLLLFWIFWMEFKLKIDDYF